jgi:hypothetical protein
MKAATRPAVESQAETCDEVARVIACTALTFVR